MIESYDPTRCANPHCRRKLSTQDLEFPGTLFEGICMACYERKYAPQGDDTPTLPTEPITQEAQNDGN